MTSYNGGKLRLNATRSDVDENDDAIHYTGHSDGPKPVQAQQGGLSEARYPDGGGCLFCLKSLNFLPPNIILPHKTIYIKFVKIFIIISARFN